MVEFEIVAKKLYFADKTEFLTILFICIKSDFFDWSKLISWTSNAQKYFT